MIYLQQSYSTRISDSIFCSIFCFTRDILVSSFFKERPSSSNYKTIIVLKKIFCFVTVRFFYNCWFTMAIAHLTSLQLKYFDSVIITSIQQLKRWKKGAHLDNIYKELIKTSEFASIPIQYLSSRLLTYHICYNIL